jgi:trehalose/maltose hydrolase-like predicted phosphorylase
VTARVDPRVLRDDRFVSANAAWKESLFTVGNGYLATRGTHEEGYSGEVRATFVNGLYVTPPDELPMLGAVPDWTRVVLAVDGEPVTVGPATTLGYERALDLRTGMLSRSLLWRGADTGVVRFGFRRLLSMDEPHLAALEVTVRALTDPVRLDVETGIDATVPSPTVPAFDTVDATRHHAGGLLGRYRSVDGAHRLTVECALRGLRDARLVADPGHPRLAATVSLGTGASARVVKLVTYHADRDRRPRPSPPGPEVGFDDVAAASARAWAARWRSSEVTVGGDPAAEQALRFAAFHLVAAASPDDPGAGIGARLMSGFGYRHHVFWDTDVFVVPYFTVTQPDLARTHFAYRHRGLDGARRKAAGFGRDGAFYAWEAAGSGDEVTPRWSVPPRGEPVRIWTGELQEHITADVAWAVDHYWAWTGDDDTMAGEGTEMVLDGARYWASRVEDEEDGAHLRRVIGPDEYHIGVDDNAYTNLMAARHLRRAAAVLDWMGEARPDRRRELAAALRLDDGAAARFRAVADRLVTPRRVDGVWEQHAGFFALEDLDLAAYEPRAQSMYDVLGEKRLQEVQVIKQADVLMAIALLPDLVDDPAAYRANWDYYAPRTDHGSSLSLPAHALVAARMGEPDLAYELFVRAAAIDLDDAMGNAAAGIHAACQGGLLQAALFGFAGLSLVDGEPHTTPRLPSHWTSFDFAFYHRGELHHRELTAASPPDGP